MARQLKTEYTEEEWDSWGKKLEEEAALEAELAMLEHLPERVSRPARVDEIKKALGRPGKRTATRGDDAEKRD